MGTPGPALLVLSCRIAFNGNTFSISQGNQVARILITSGPTREYLDPVRYLTNASSGKMGAALAQAAQAAGHVPVVVSGPVEIDYPEQVEVIEVVTTEEMLTACRSIFADCDGLFGVAAACDYRPVHVAEHKIKKTGQPLLVELVETSDIMAELAREKSGQWLVGFALETEDAHFRAMTKLQKKNCDLIVLNGPQAMHAEATEVEVLSATGESLLRASGSKLAVAQALMGLVEEKLIG